jgi:uncharacterized protein YdcH (DUF465 family)
MNNQWGRSGSGPAGSSGIGGILFASVVCLALGAAAGYGAFRMMEDAPSQSDIEARDTRIAELARELDERAAQVEENTRKVRALSEENGTLKRQAEALRKDAGVSGSDVAVIAAERTRLAQEVVPDLENKLQLLGQRVADAEALKKKAEEAVKDRERRLLLQTDKMAGLEKTCTQQAAARNLEADGLKTQTVRLRDELDKIRKSEEALRTKDVPALKDEISRKDTEIAALSERAKALTGRVEALSAASCMALPKEPNGNGKKVVPEEDATRDAASDIPVQALTPRNGARVTEAMREAPGLDSLTSVQREQLERSLVAGECVTGALSGVFRRIPVLALRNLMRDLDSDC